MYYIDVQKGWEMEHHTQTAVNNFLGMHRYDATFQIKVGAWTGDKSHYAYGNVLTWKHLFSNGHYRKSPSGKIALADNKGTTWHSGVYGNELSEHVLGAWQIYQHTGDVEFLGEKQTRWPAIRYERTESKNEKGSEITKSIRVTDCPLRITIEPWSEKKRVIRSDRQPTGIADPKSNGQNPTASTYPHGSSYVFDASQSTAYVELHLERISTDHREK